jgi:hypothetical protein
MAFPLVAEENCELLFAGSRAGAVGMLKDLDLS